jgi:putative peptide zinc metalloprotease protein
MATHYQLKPGCSFFPFHNGSSDDEFIIRTADNRQFRISAAARQLLESLNQGTSLEQIYAHLSATQPDLTWEKLDNLIRRHYSAVLVCSTGENIVAEEPARPKARIIFARSLLKQEIVQKIAALFSVLFLPAVAITLCVVVVLAHLWLYLSYKALPGARGHVFIVLVATLSSIIVHEFGHASAVARFGGKPGPIGWGLYILIPVFFADVSQVWTFQRRQRAIVDLGGIYFQQLAFLVFATVAVLFHSPSFKGACLGIDVMAMIAINPVFRFDGYWVLVDWLGIPNLQKVSIQYLKSAVNSICHLKWPGFRALNLRAGRLQSAVFVFYALIGNPLFIIFIFWNYRWLKSTILSVVRLSPLLFRQTVASIQMHDLIKTLDLLTALLFLSASAVTLLIAVCLRGRQVADFIWTRARVPRGNSKGLFTATRAPEGRNTL